MIEGNGVLALPRGDRALKYAYVLSWREGWEIGDLLGQTVKGLKAQFTKQFGDRLMVFYCVRRPEYIGKSKSFQYGAIIESGYLSHGHLTTDYKAETDPGL